MPHVSRRRVEMTVVPYKDGARTVSNAFCIPIGFVGILRAADFVHGDWLRRTCPRRIFRRKSDG